MSSPRYTGIIHACMCVCMGGGGSCVCVWASVSVFVIRVTTRFSLSTDKDKAFKSSILTCFKENQTKLFDPRQPADEVLAFQHTIFLF